jgi:hypothetical protein
MSFPIQRPPAARLTATLSAMCDFLEDPHCRRCDILAVCLNRLHEDVSELDAASLKRLPQILRQGSLSTSIRRHFHCQRCAPAEILATYLTPEEKNLRLDVEFFPVLSWIEGDQDLHY